jgi:Predicted phosphohydrolases
VKLTEKMVEEVNSVNPDLIIIAGDIFTSNYEGLRNPEAYSAALSKMKAKYGIYAVAGNHDVDENLFSGFSISPVSEAFRTSEMDKFFSDCGFTMLYDESIEVADGNVVLVGRIDAEKAGDGTKNRMSAKLLLKNVDKSKPVFVLQHEPTEFKDLSENGADAVFSGHTHNGQVFPGNLVVPFFNENGYGVKELYGITTVVTAGVGYYGPPIRIGTDSEVTVVNILFQ